MSDRQTKAELAYENSLNGESIMLCRAALAEVGIEAAFHDDCGALAAAEIRRLRGEVPRGQGDCGATSPKDSSRWCTNPRGHEREHESANPRLVTLRWMR